MKRRRRTWTADQKRIVAAENNWRCGICNNLLNAAFEIDHVIALENGGIDDIGSNAQALCANCHALKSQKERVERIEKAKEQLEKYKFENSKQPIIIQQKTKPEDVILDAENPFANFAFMKFKVKSKQMSVVGGGVSVEKIGSTPRDTHISLSKHG